MRRVVVTGLGMVTPLGAGADHNWAELTAGKSGIRAITHCDVSDLPARVAGLIPRKPQFDGPGSFDADAIMDVRERKRVDDFIVLGVAAAEEAIADSGWKAASDDDAYRTGVMIGSGIGGLDVIAEYAQVLQEKGPRRVSPFFIPSALINLVSGHVSIRHGFKGPNHAVVTACSTGAHAIGDAARMIMLDDADVMIAGGAESAVNRLGLAGFAAARTLSTSYNDDPPAASRPFDKGRDGFVMGEGSGIVVLEEREHALARGAKIYAEVTGYGLSGDAHHITSPPEDGNGGYRAMQMALKRAGLTPNDIDYINAHGTSTPVGDEIEIGAIRRLFGEPRIFDVSISSTKSATGHLLGAAGAIEAIFSIKAVQTDLVPPTRNLTNPADSLADLDLVPIHAKQREVRAALSNSFGFGGTNACLIVTKHAA